MSEIFGNIHSIETGGMVDGPGIRFVVFMQGCPMRCKYCHNPDTWDLGENKKYTVDKLLSDYEKVKGFCAGGITVTGGEPLVQIDFLTDLFRTANNKNIHTTLDTSGITFDKSNIEKFDELIKYTNLVMLDIKHIDNEEHKKLTGHFNENILNFAQYLSENKIPVWIRHVIVPGITLNDNYLLKLGEFLGTLNNIKALDVLPYHNMAIAKYENLGIDYSLKNTPIPSKEDALHARNIIIQGIKQAKHLV